MTQQDAETIIAVATLAAMADGQQDASELASIAEAASRLGLGGADAMVQQAANGQVTVSQLAEQLSDADARHTAYDVAVAVCNADGAPNPMELDFLRSLAETLAIDPTASNSVASDAAASAGPAALAPSDSPPDPITPDALTTHILDQAMLTAALELLPDRLANLAILPLQMRLVRHIGQQYGQQTDLNQIKDLAATFGLGAAAQVMESVVRKAFGGIASGLLGGLFGGAAGVAAGGAVTFASTYALGHAAQQYYAQGRSLSTTDMKALFARFQGDANTVYPQVQARIATLAQGTSFDAVIRSIRG